MVSTFCDGELGQWFKAKRDWARRPWASGATWWAKPLLYFARLRRRESPENEGLAEVAQLVEQWSEESRAMRFAKLLGNSRLIPKFKREEQWSKWSIVWKVRRAVPKRQLFS